MYRNHYIAVFLGYLDVKDNEMYSRAPKFVIYEQKKLNREKKKLTKLSSGRGGSQFFFTKSKKKHFVMPPFSSIVGM